MIIIPEIETVFLHPPRTGAQAVKKGIKERYRGAFEITKHLEACSIPEEFSTYTKMGILRNPLDRLFSLYKHYKLEGAWDGPFNEELRANSVLPFDEWILKNNHIFAKPEVADKTYPKYLTIHKLPENRKSQYFYLRPDLGTIVIPYEHIQEIENGLDIKITSTTNSTRDVPPRKTPLIGGDALLHMQTFFHWDHTFHTQLLRTLKS